MLKNVNREITPLSASDSFLVFDRVKSEFDFPIHFHPEYELNFIKDGKGLKRVAGDNVEEIEDYELVLLGPNLHHGWLDSGVKDRLYHEITIQFHQDLLGDKLLSKQILKPIQDMFNRSVHGILFSESTCMRLYDKLKSLSKIDGMDYFLEFLSILHELATSQNQRLLSTFTPNKDSFQNSDKIKDVYDFVHSNYSRKITLEEISNVVNMSEVSFNRFIKKRTGKTFVDYVNHVRVGYAAMKLIDKDQSVSEIAFDCGFNNIANFNRVFKKLKNQTPTQYVKEFSGIKRIL